MSKIFYGKISPEVMDGDNDLEKWLNYYLTSQFLIDKNIPTDECLTETKKIIEEIRKWDLTSLYPE